MQRFFKYNWMLLLLVVLLTACKKEVNVDELNNNPFDADYVGDDPIVLTDSYIGFDGNGFFQALEFNVKSNLFLSDLTDYTMRMTNSTASNFQEVNHINGQPHEFTFKYRFATQGVPNCYEISMYIGGLRQGVRTANGCYNAF
jgi:hypothetical protein